MSFDEKELEDEGMYYPWLLVTSIIVDYGTEEGN